MKTPQTVTKRLEVLFNEKEDVKLVSELCELALANRIKDDVDTVQVLHEIVWGDRTDLEDVVKPRTRKMSQETANKRFAEQLEKLKKRYNQQ